MFKKKIQFLLSKIYVFKKKKKRSCPSFTAYLYAYKTREHCTGAEKADVELASKVDKIYTGKAGWEMPHQLWLIKSLSRLSQTKQDTTRWLPELCTAKTT